MIKYILALLVLIGCSSSDSTPCPTKNCSDYKTQLEAQSAFDANKTCLKNLDDDNDGVACEQVFISSGTGVGTGGTTTPGTGCPTTTACGCSNKTKAQCGDPCCKWTVGSGCGCK